MTEEYVLFVETDTKLQSALSFSQYALPIGSSFRLITIIGEQHELEFKCEKEKPSISVAEYALDTLRNNFRAQVLLEIDSDFIPYPSHWPNSVPIREILAQAKKGKGLMERIVGYDWRNFWLGADNRELLYHDTSRVLTFPGAKIFDIYLGPFYSKKGNLRVDKEDYDARAFRFLNETFPADLHSDIARIKKDLEESWDMYRKRVVITGMGNYKSYKGRVTGVGNGDVLPVELEINGRTVRVKRKRLLLAGKGKNELEARTEIVKSLQHFWKKVTDWNMLKWVFHISGFDEIISIMGEQHRINLSAIFSDLRKLTEQVGKGGDCVSLMKTVHIKK